jgi:hypothetical protein
VIRAVTGTPGSGKSFYEVCRLHDQLSRGGYVATNLPLREDWAEVLARGLLLRRPFSRLWKRVAAGYRDRLFWSEDLTELCAVKLLDKRVRHFRNREGIGLMIVDEAHEHLNARGWDQADRERVVKSISRSRHRGWDVDLVTQSIDSIDKQIRDRVEYEDRLRNLHRAQMLGMPLLPVNAFLMVRLWHGGPRTATPKPSGYKLRLIDYHGRAYDTHGLQELAHDELLDGTLAPVLLPHSWALREAAGTPGEAGAGPLALPPAEAA